MTEFVSKDTSCHAVRSSGRNEQLQHLSHDRANPHHKTSLFHICNKPVFQANLENLDNLKNLSTRKQSSGKMLENLENPSTNQSSGKMLKNLENLENLANLSTNQSSGPNLQGDEGGETPRWSKFQILPTLHLFHRLFNVSQGISNIIKRCSIFHLWFQYWILLKIFVWSFVFISRKPVWAGFLRGIKTFVVEKEKISREGNNP